MILVTAGHEKSIGTEVFLKSFLLLTKEQKSNFHLFTDHNALISNLEFLGLNFKISEDLLNLDSGNLKLTLFDKDKYSTPASTIALLKALEVIDEHRDILIGHTEFFRNLYGSDYMSMNFLSPEEKILLVTDHLPLKDVTDSLNSDLIYFKVAHSILGYEQFFSAMDEIILAGINPHAGENGLMGHGEEEICKGIQKLKKTFPKIKFKGPLSGDALHFEKNPEKSQLFVYMYHDQGLATFKAKNGLIGINLTFGLPFLRLSVDHGTAFDLYGKNAANYMGQYYLLNQALKAHTSLKSQKVYYGVRSNQNLQGPRPQP
jgi:4-hydroxythreonine-4-phosphate dehydrogenase